MTEIFDAFHNNTHQSQSKSNTTMQVLPLLQWVISSIIVYSKKEKSDYGKTRGREKTIIARMKICASDLIFPIVAIYVSFTDAVYHLETAVNN